MVHRDKVINGVIAYMENHMIPNAKDNYKIILRTVQAGMSIAPEKIELLKRLSKKWIKVAIVLKKIC